MNQEKIGNKIKSIRVSNNLTQKEFADSLGVTYQAVSKWENGKNLPDISLLREISEKYNVDINELLDIKETNEPKEQSRKVNIKMIIIATISVVVMLSIIIGGIIITKKNNDFSFKTLDTTCSEFKISGSVAYNSSKTVIYLSHVDYCGKDDVSKIKYSKIVADLYLSNEDTDKKLYTESKENITLNDYLENFSMSVKSNICIEFKGDLSLKINAYDENDKITVYEIPLELSDSCNLN